MVWHCVWLSAGCFVDQLLFCGRVDRQPKPSAAPTTEETLSEAQAVLPEFLKAYVPFDGEQSDAYLGRVYRYLTPAKLTAGSQWYNVDVVVIHTATDGTQERGGLLYVVQLVRADCKWLIDDVGIRHGSGSMVE